MGGPWLVMRGVWRRVVRLCLLEKSKGAPKPLSWSDKESLLVFKRGASFAVAVRARSGPRSSVCMATAGRWAHGPLLFPPTARSWRRRGKGTVQLEVDEANGRRGPGGMEEATVGSKRVGDDVEDG